MNKPPLTELDYFTHYVAAYLPLQLSTADECIDWARDMVEAGRETEHILILAACDKPANYFEIEGYLKKVIIEIGYPERDKEEFVVCHLGYLIYQLAHCEKIQMNLRKISTLAFSINEKLDEFHTLYYGWDDLMFGEHYLQEYWPGATLANIESLIVQQARQWLIEHDDFLRLK
ncbi:MAG: hypothetical protein KF744_02330 [Taibaiella sp.]|nr:hypothetical protein [Taibaiella sp.]